MPRDTIYANLTSSEGGICCVWIGQSKTKGRIEGDQKRAFDASLKDFQIALRTRGMLCAKDEVIRNLQFAIDRLNHGFIAIDENLRILVRNRAADEILAKSDGLSERRGLLKFHYALDQKFAEDAARAMGNRHFPASHQGMPVRRPSMLPPYRAKFAPSEGLATGIGATQSAAILTLYDPLSPKEPEEPKVLADQYGLSLAEARVTRLAALGMTKNEVAKELGVTENTVKTQLARAREELRARNLAHLAYLIG